MKTSFKITNLTCEACVKLSNLALSDIPGVTSFEVDLKTGHAHVESDREISMSEIESALGTVGKTVQIIN